MNAVKGAVAKDESGLFKRMLEQFPANSTEKASDLLIAIIDMATRETSGGEFINVDGSKIPW